MDGTGNWQYHNSNLDSQSTTDNKSFTANEFNAYTQAGGASMTYDTNGNLTRNGQRNQILRWDAFNRLVGVYDAPTTTIVSFLYDAAGRRVRKSAGPAVVTQAATGAHYGFYDHSQLLADDEWAGSGSFLAEDFGTSQYGGAPFSIPPDATITGVAVTVRRREANGNSPQEDLLVLKTDDQTGQDKAGTIAWSGGAETVVYGGQNDTWGLSLTPALVNANQLKLEYDTSYGEAQYDFVAINAYYSIVQGAGTPTAVYDWAYDGNQILEERYNSVGPKKQWVYGRYIDEPLVMDVDETNNGSCLDFSPNGDKRYFYHQNLNYSVIGLTNASGVLVEAYEYTPYGQHITLSHGGTAVLFDGTDTITANGASPVGNPYFFTGRQFDPETGMNYYRARYYDAVLGRFVSRDPIGCGGGINIYAYASLNPINASDILGLVDWRIGSDEKPYWLFDWMKTDFPPANMPIDCRFDPQVYIRNERNYLKLGAAIKLSGEPDAEDAFDHFVDGSGLRFDFDGLRMIKENEKALESVRNVVVYGAIFASTLSSTTDFIGDQRNVPPDYEAFGQHIIHYTGDIVNGIAATTDKMAVEGVAEGPDLNGKSNWQIAVAGFFMKARGHVTCENGKRSGYIVVRMGDWYNFHYAWTIPLNGDPSFNNMAFSAQIRGIGKPYPREGGSVIVNIPDFNHYDIKDINDQLLNHQSRSNS